MKNQITKIASLLTEDPDIINELGPEGGRQPGKDNEPGSSAGSSEYEQLGQTGKFSSIRVHKLTQKTQKLVAKFGLEPRVFDRYAPVYIIFRDGEPWVAGSEANDTTWYDTTGNPVEMDPELLAGLGISKYFF